MTALTSRRKNTLIALGLILGIVLVCVASVVWLLPTLIQTRLPLWLAETTGKATTIQKVALGFMPLSLRVKDFAIQDQANQPLVTLDELYLEIDTAESIKQRALVITKLSVDKPLVQLSKNQDGKLNIIELFGTAKPPESPASKPFPLLVGQLDLHEGKLVYNDAKQPDLAATLYPLDIEINRFSTYIGQPASVKLSFNLDSGAKVAWAGNLGLSPIHSEGNLKLTSLDLKKALRFAAIDSLTGLGDADIDYQADYGDEGLRLAADKTQLSFKDLHYQQPDMSLKIAKLGHDANLTLTHKNGLLKLVMGNAKLSFKDMRFQQPRVSIDLANLDHETELTLTQNNNGQLRISAKTAKTTAQQLQIQNPTSVTTNNVSIDSPYQLTFSEQGLDFIAKQGDIVANGLQLAQQESKQTVLDISSFKAHDINLSWAGRRLDIGSITIDKADGQAVLNADGSLNIQKLLDANGKPPAPDNGDAGAEKKTWQIAAQTLSLNDGAVNFTDQTLASPITVNFKPIHLTVAGYDNQKPGPLPVTLDTRVNGGGSVKLNGDLNLSPLTTKLDIAVKNIDLEKFKGYFSRFVRLSLIDGRADLDGRLELAALDPLALTFQGNAGIADWLTRDQRVFKDFVKWKNLNLSGIALDTAANRYIAKQLTLDKPYARVIIRKDKTINFDKLLIAQDKPNKAATPKPAKPPTPLYLQLDKLKVNGGSSDFSDLSLILPFSAHIENLHGGAEGMSSASNSNINLSLAGDAYDLSPVTINGNLSPYRGDYDIAINFEGLPMPLVSPYMVQFAGYKVEKGKMSLSLFYKVTDKKLTANNKILIDQFELGEKVENPEAVSLPLKLAVALLKDGNGRIRFDVPITGSLENPQFSLRAVIVDAVSNALLKIVSSPFSLLSALSDGEEDLSSILFSPGHDDLTQAEKTKLNSLAAALTERPGLTLGIKGVAYQRQDWPDISDDALLDQLRQRRADEINKNAEVKIRAEYVSLSNDDHKRLLAEMFIEKFPALAEKSLLGAPQLKNGQAGDFYETAKDKLTDVINPEPQRLKELAIARAKAIAKYLVKHGKVSQEQIFILDPLVDQEKNDKAIPSVLSLKAD